jgi:hypothetical protein
MVNATNSDGNSSDKTIQGGKMERNYKNDGSSTKVKQTGDQKSGIYEIQDHTSRSTTTIYKYPQVRKTGVDAVHGSCPQMVYIMKNCNL